MKSTKTNICCSSLTRACKFKNDRVHLRLPIYKDLAEIILAQTKAYFHDLGQLYLSSLYRAMFASVYYGLLRIGEMASGANPVKAIDVHVGENKQKILFILRMSKTHWTDEKPQHIKISSSTKFGKKWEPRDTSKCPFEILRNYIAVHPTGVNINEPFFIFKDGSPVQPCHVRATLKHMLLLSGFNNELYDTHSYRIGCCCDLYKMGFSISAIRKIGRWKSSCVYSYLSYQ